MGEFEETTEVTIENESAMTFFRITTTPHGEVVVTEGLEEPKVTQLKRQKMENKIKVYVLEKLPSDWKRTFTEAHKVDGSYAMIYIKEQHAWLQQIDYTTKGVEAHTKAYYRPLPLMSLDTGIEEARIVWKTFVEDGYNRLSLTEGPFHLNTLIDEDIEIIA